MVKNVAELNKVWAKQEMLVTVSSADGSLRTFTCAPGKLAMVAPGIIAGSGTRKANANPTIFTMDIRSAIVEVSDNKDKDNGYRAPLFASEKAFYAEYHAQYSNGNGKAKVEAPVKKASPPKLPGKAKAPKKPRKPVKVKGKDELAIEAMTLLNDNVYEGKLDVTEWIAYAESEGIDITSYDAMAQFVHDN